MLIDSVSVAGNIFKVYLFHFVDRPFGVLCLQSGIDESSNIAFQFPTMYLQIAIHEESSSADLHQS